MNIPDPVVESEHTIILPARGARIKM